MKTNKILVALALTLTTGAAIPFNSFLPNYSLTVSAETDDTKAVDNYAHNYDYIGLDFNDRGFIGSPDIVTPKANSFDDRICVFSIVNVTEDGDEYCTDYFIKKEIYEEEGFELCATYGSNNENSKFFLLLWKSSKSPMQAIGLTNYETRLVHTDKGIEKIGPRVKDWRDEYRPFIGENKVLYCNVDDMPVHFYNLGGNRNWQWSYRGPDKEIGTLNKDGSVALYNNVIRLGDVNHDNVIDIEDVTIIQNHINGVKALDDKYIWAADVNGDGVVDIEDVVAIMNQINGVSSFENDYESENYRLLEESPKTVTPPAANTTITTSTTTTSTSTTSTATSDTTTSEATTTPGSELQVTKVGDANCDGQVDMADAVLIMQALANPNKYGIVGTYEYALTEQGQINADVDKTSIGLTSNDALKIQQLLLGIIKSF